MKKGMAISFALLSALLLFFSLGCSSGSQTPKDKNYRTGTQGIFMEFMPNQPPYQIYAEEPLDLMIKLTNKGATDVVGGFLYLSGYDTTILDSLTSQSGELSYYSFAAEGKDEYNPNGDMFTTADFKDENGPILPPGVDQFQMTFKATACYRYETIATAKICIDPNPGNVNVEHKVCQVRNVGLGSQGGPISVTQVEEQMNGRKAVFTIYFKNSGKGDVFVREMNPSDISMCHNNLHFDDVNKVILTSVEISGTDIVGSCKPEGSVKRLFNGAGKVICVCDDCVNSDSMDAYETLMTIKLNYGYRDSILKTVQVKRNPWENP